MLTLMLLVAEIWTIQIQRERESRERERERGGGGYSVCERKGESV